MKNKETIIKGAVITISSIFVAFLTVLYFLPTNLTTYSRYQTGVNCESKNGTVFTSYLDFKNFIVEEAKQSAYKYSSEYFNDHALVLSVRKGSSFEFSKVVKTSSKNDLMTITYAVEYDDINTGKEEDESVFFLDFIEISKNTYYERFLLTYNDLRA